MARIVNEAHLNAFQRAHLVNTQLNTSLKQRNPGFMTTPMELTYLIMNLLIKTERQEMVVVSEYM